MIGIMQGRLSPQIDGQIQCFPADFWKAEFFIANAIGIPLIEWTLDRFDIERNPFIIDHKKIKDISFASEVLVSSVTYDAAMQSPLVINGEVQKIEVELLCNVLQNARNLGVGTLVLPLVDGSSVFDCDYLQYIKLLNNIGKNYLDTNLRIAIESDFSPKKLVKFIDEIDSVWIGVNYDIGNSAALGFDFDEEMRLIGNKIFNIHVKDRPLGGVTCPFGKGTSGLQNKINVLYESFRNINMIIQGARSKNGNDVGTAIEYFEYIQKALKNGNINNR